MVLFFTKQTSSRGICTSGCYRGFGLGRGIVMTWLERFLEGNAERDAVTYVEGIYL